MSVPSSVGDASAWSFLLVVSVCGAAGVCVPGGRHRSRVEVECEDGGSSPATTARGSRNGGEPPRPLAVSRPASSPGLGW